MVEALQGATWPTKTEKDSRCFEVEREFLTLANNLRINRHLKNRCCLARTGSWERVPQDGASSRVGDKNLKELLRPAKSVNDFQAINDKIRVNTPEKPKID